MGLRLGLAVPINEPAVIPRNPKSPQVPDPVIAPVAAAPPCITRRGELLCIYPKMKELTAINPYTSDGSKKRGMCPFETAKKVRRLWAEETKKIEEQYGCSEYPERVVSSIPFEEQPFGSLVAEPAECDDDDAPPPAVVSLALFDEDEMLFACSGIALPDGTTSNRLTRILTSARLVAVFNEKRNRDDKLRIDVRVPHRLPYNGFVELYDDDIAIVTSLALPNIFPVDLDLQETYLPDGTEVLATGRTFKTFDLMVAHGRLIDGPSGDDRRHLRISNCDITEAGLGGPLIDSGQNFVGMNIHCAMGKTWFLSRTLIRERLEQFKIIAPRNMEGGDNAEMEHADDLSGSGSTSVATKTSSQGYCPPPGASTIVPSGSLRYHKWLHSMGYPKPPPLMLELNGELLHTFEEFFGYIDASKGYLFNTFLCAEGKNPWLRLRRQTIQRTYRRVVALASFNGASRFFACTGFLIKCRVGQCYGSVRPSCTVVLTSASLVRTCDATDTIDEKLRIEVFLPPNQRVSGTLVAYDSYYNLAIIRAECLRAICPEDILLVDAPPDIGDRELRKMCREEPVLKHVIAIGRDPEQGLLCGSMGEVSKEPITHGSEELRRSTCKIKKAGIGGPLISYGDENFAGMNFYDGGNHGTPFLPKRDHHAVQKLDSPDDGTNYSNRWPVPKARWYNSILEVDSRERQRL